MNFFPTENKPRPVGQLTEHMSFIRTTEPRGSTSPSAGLGRSSSPEQGSPSVGFSSQQQWLKGLFFMFCTPQYRFISALVQSVMSPLPQPFGFFSSRKEVSVFVFGCLFPSLPPVAFPSFDRPLPRSRRSVSYLFLLFYFSRCFFSPAPCCC